MLAKANRLVRADEYRNAVRKGKKTSSSSAVIYRVRRSDDLPARFGFIVAKTVGNAVTRNRVRRRLKAASYEISRVVAPGTSVVIRALPASATASWASLRREIVETLSPGEGAR